EWGAASTGRRLTSAAQPQETRVRSSQVAPIPRISRPRGPEPHAPADLHLQASSGELPVLHLAVEYRFGSREIRGSTELHRVLHLHENGAGALHHGTVHRGHGGRGPPDRVGSRDLTQPKTHGPRNCSNARLRP